MKIILFGQAIIILLQLYLFLDGILTDHSWTLEIMLLTNFVLLLTIISMIISQMEMQTVLLMGYN